MKKTIVALSTATLLVGSLIGCGVHQGADQNRTGTGAGTYQANQGTLTGFDAEGGAGGGDTITPTEPGGTTGDTVAVEPGAGTPGGGDATPGAGDAGAGDATTPGGGAGDETTPGAETGDEAAGEGAETPEGTTGDETGTPATPGGDTVATEPGATPAQTPFPDVGKGNTHVEDIRWAKENNIITGYQDGTFKPSNNLTRAEAAALMRRIHDLLNNNAGAGTGQAGS